MKTPYNGHESWTAWNTSLWIYNDEDVYQEWRKYVIAFSLNKAVNLLTAKYTGTKTPDGAKYSRHNIKLIVKDLLENL